MLPVEIMYSHGAVILRARNSELLILQQHVKALHSLKQPREFSQYFMQEALLNRPARKLFEAWLRKDKTVWPRLFKTVQENFKEEDMTAFEDASSQVEPTEPETQVETEPKLDKTTSAKSTAKVSDEKKQETKKTNSKAKASSKTPEQKDVKKKNSSVSKAKSKKEEEAPKKKTSKKTKTETSSKKSSKKSESSKSKKTTTKKTTSKKTTTKKSTSKKTKKKTS